MAIKHPYLLFLGDAHDQLAAKTADGVAFWRSEWCLGQFRLPGCKADLKLPDMSVEAAAAAGAKTLMVGVANRGGVVAESWIPVLTRSLERGLDLAAGLHRRLADVPALKATAERLGRSIFDVRHPTQEFHVASGKPRSGKRLLTVGTDCSIGKMFTSLAFERELRKRGAKADFRATGQTGILIAGEGVSVDAVVADFQRRGSLGSDRGSGLVVPRILRRGQPRLAPWCPADGDRDVPRAQPHPHAGFAGFSSSEPARVHRGEFEGGAPHQPHRRLCRYFHQYVGARRLGGGQHPEANSGLVRAAVRRSRARLENRRQVEMADAQLLQVRDE